MPSPNGSLAYVGAFLISRYFRNRVDATVSLVLLALLAVGLGKLIDWAFIDSVLVADSAAECAERGSGACWAVLSARIRIILFGVYPFEEQRRPATACSVLLFAIVLTCLPQLWSLRRLAVLWTGSFALFFALMRGGFLGLPAVLSENWGGLALTFFVFASVILLGMPLAMLMALARWSGPRWLRIITGAVIDLVRSVPLIAVLFGAAVVLPAVLPDWLAGDKIYRVVIGFALFFAAYQAEVIRGGLQALEKGQIEAAKSLGLRYWTYQYKIVLPQVFRTTLPQTVNQSVAAFKDTSYVAIVGFFDLVAAASAALGTGDWAMAFVEVYAVVGLIYLVLGYSLSRYGAYLERRVGVAYRR